MPSPRVLDLNPNPRIELTPLEKTLSAFSERNRENQLQQQETDALKQIYAEYQQDGGNLQQTLMDIQTRPGISPTTRVNSAKQLLEFGKYNTELQKKAREDVEKSEKKANELKQTEIIEDQRDLERGSLAPFAGNASLAERTTRPAGQAKVNQADRQITQEQLDAIEKVETSPEWANATNPQRTRLLQRGKVSTANIESTMKPYIEEEKNVVAREKAENAKTLDFHKSSEKYDEELTKAAKGAKNQLSAIKDVRKALDKGAAKPSSLANIFRSFGEVGRAISNALISDDQAVIQASIPAFLEGRKELFGVRLSDADLKLLQDKLPDISKKKSANVAILNLMERYSDAALLRFDIGDRIKEENKGLRPLNYAQQIEKRYDNMMTPVKIRNPHNGRIIEIPFYKADEYVEDGGELIKDEAGENG